MTMMIVMMVSLHYGKERRGGEMKRREMSLLLETKKRCGAWRTRRRGLASAAKP